MIKPVIADSCYIAEDATVIGNVEIKEKSSVWNHATIRSAHQPITIGSETNIQDNAVVHVDKDFKVIIGSRVTIGHGAIVHGCTISDNTLIGMGSIILNGAVIGKNCIVGAGALVTQNVIIPDGSLVTGNPAKVVRRITQQEEADIINNARMYVEEAEEASRV